MSHIKEPMLIEDDGSPTYLDGIEAQFMLRWSNGDEVGFLFRRDDARRIVACVNACAGISTELIEQGGFAAVPVATHRDVKKQRDDLLSSALRAVEAWDTTVLPASSDGMMQERMESLRASVAAVKGGS